MRRRLVFFSLLGVVLAAGWIKPVRQIHAGVYPVDGRLIISDKPADNAALAFHPIGKSSASLARPVAMTRPDGSFRLTTFRRDDGAPAGEYVVTVIWHDPSAPVDECECQDPTEHDRLCGLYADPEVSPLRATIRRGKDPNQITLIATACSERTRLEMQLRRSASRSVLGSFLGNENRPTNISQQPR